jgi:hypothetical protein
MISGLVDSVEPIFAISPYNDCFDFQLDFSISRSKQFPIGAPLAIYAIIDFLSSLVRYHPEFLESLLVHRGVQKIHPIGALVWLEPSRCGVRGQPRMNLLSAPVH